MNIWGRILSLKSSSNRRYCYTPFWIDMVARDLQWHTCLFLRCELSRCPLPERMHLRWYHNARSVPTDGNEKEKTNKTSNNKKQTQNKHTNEAPRKFGMFVAAGPFFCIGRRFVLLTGRRLFFVHWPQALCCAFVAGSFLCTGRRLFVVHWSQALFCSLAAGLPFILKAFASPVLACTLPLTLKWVGRFWLNVVPRFD